MVDSSDSELWAQVEAGSAEAFGKLFERHAKSVYNYCFRRTGDWTSAEDLVSVVFLEVWRKPERVVIRRGTLLPWLLGVATNLSRNHRRSLRRYEAALGRLPDPNAGITPDFTEDLLGRLEAQSRLRPILTELRKLPLREQEVLALCVWTGLSYEDASVALCVPIGTIRSRLARARKHLRALVSDPGRESNHHVGIAIPCEPQEVPK